MAKVKGSAILESVRILRRNKDAARKHLAPELQHYLSERVLVASWYPEISAGCIAATFEKNGYAGVRVEKQSCRVDGAPECA